MSKIYSSQLELVGHTPLVEVQRVAARRSLRARLLVKLESYNPAGSVKDRTALAMIEAAERDGILRPGSTIVEATSGNTGVGLAFAAAVKGYAVVIVMPETMSVERRRLVAAYGARLELTPGAEGMKGALARAETLRASIDGAVTLGQFVNPANPAVHAATTGEEVWNDTEGGVDVFVAGVGTGGTVSGVGKALKAHRPEVEIVAVEPDASPRVERRDGRSPQDSGHRCRFCAGNLRRQRGRPYFARHQRRSHCRHPRAGSGRGDALRHLVGSCFQCCPPIGRR